MVLIASRDGALRITQEKIFRDAGYSILTASSPSEAENVLRNLLLRLVAGSHRARL
jgi:hypothetical protein